MMFEESWLNVGVHSTPDKLAATLAALVEEHLGPGVGYQGALDVLDLFAGDGRLGLATSAQLEAQGLSAKVTFVDVVEPERKPTSTGSWLVANAFRLGPEKLFDIVVCNPPYRRLTRAHAISLGFSWKDVVLASQNLYCMGILKALELCRPGGLVAAIAPFGWVKGDLAFYFRGQLAKICSEMIVWPEESRRLFPGVSQDIALQLFRKGAVDGAAGSGPSVQFKGRSLELESGRPVRDYGASAFPRVRVGPLVWNRARKWLRATGRESYLVIYGGAIRDGVLDLDKSRYRKKQYVKSSGIPEGAVSKGRCILIRRTLRGNPGDWIVDSCATREEFCGVVENHAIVVELGSLGISSEEFRVRLMGYLEAHCALLGNPILNTSAVKLATKLTVEDLL